tara:strand:- start:1104 stop:1421 length:318 start_codon:yes stop_codon:yes gene_type:complete
MLPDTQSHARRRLKIIAGQVEALQKKVEEDRYCLDLLDLSLSVQRALRSLDALVLEGHLRTHVIEQVTNGESERAVQELLRVYKIQGPTESTTAIQMDQEGGDSA